MPVRYLHEMPKIDMTPSGAKNAVKQVAIGPAEGWEDYVMRIMTVEVGGNTPKHTHDWPHINYVIDGKGILLIDGEEHEIEKGACAYVPSGAEHGFTNVGSEELSFICIVPKQGEF